MLHHSHVISLTLFAKQRNGTTVRRYDGMTVWRYNGTTVMFHYFISFELKL